MKKQNKKTALIVKLPDDYAEKLATGAATTALLRSHPQECDLKLHSRLLIQRASDGGIIGEATVDIMDICPVDSNMNGPAYAVQYYMEAGMSIHAAIKYLADAEIPAAIGVAGAVKYAHPVEIHPISRSWRFADDILCEMCTEAKNTI